MVDLLSGCRNPVRIQIFFRSFCNTIVTRPQDNTCTRIDTPRLIYSYLYKTVKYSFNFYSQLRLTDCTLSYLSVPRAAPCILISQCSDGLSCFTGVTDAGYQYRAIVVDSHKLRICQNSTGSVRFCTSSKPAWVTLIMHSISLNTEPVTSVRLFTVGYVRVNC